MLAELPTIGDCGEVYLPANLLYELEDWEPADRTAFLDCIHLAHHPTGRLHADEILINSAHHSGWRLANAYGPEARVVLLIRDPLDIVLSRTLRKPEYREGVAPQASDAEYLASNIAFVSRFYDAAQRAHHDIVVSYEDLRNNATQVLAKVRDAVGFSASDTQLSAAAGRHQPGSETTNTYRGARVEPPAELVDVATERLLPLRKAWGYG